MVRSIPLSDVRWVVIYVAAVVVLFLSGLDNGPFLEFYWPSWVSVTAMIVAALLTVFRTVKPEVLLFVVLPLCLAEILFGTQVSAFILLVEALWAPVARGSARTAKWTTWAGGIVGAALATIWFFALSGELPWTSVAVLSAMFAGAIIFTPLAWAWEVRNHRMAQQAAEKMAEMEHELAGERAAREVETERVRIAQDLHDVVAGHLSAVALHSSLAAELPDEDSRKLSLDTARSSAESALRDLRAVIEVLAEGRESTGLTTLTWTTLSQRLGPSADVQIDPADADVAAQTAMLHIAYEAVTNAVRHGAEPRTLHVCTRGDTLTMSCTNAVVGNTQSSGPTFGLQSMANRAAAVRGEVFTGESDGVWTVSATVPLSREENF